MTENEWDSMHPELATAHVTAWENREKRMELRLAGVQLIIASSAGTKRAGGGRLTIDDFLPDYCKPKNEKRAEEKEMAIKKWFMARATN